MQTTFKTKEAKGRDLSSSCRYSTKFSWWVHLKFLTTDLHVDLKFSMEILGPSNSVSTVTSNVESTSPASGSSTPHALSFVPVCDLSLPLPSESLPPSHHYHCLNELTCLGQSVQWEPGTMWDSYAFHQHLDGDTMPWDPIWFNGPNQIVLRSKKCTK